MTPLDYAESQLGVKEKRGSKHHPAILRYHATTTLGAWGRSRDETPWCSSFVNWCFVKANGPLEPGSQHWLPKKGIWVWGPTNNALARSWATWGSPCQQSNLAIAALQPVAVLKHRLGKARSVGSRGGYHVIFPYRITKRWISGIGGNQGDAVTFKRFSRRRWDLVALRKAT